ncbi:MAG: nickel pincer cofactor biosynthesis protein LarC [Ignavibacteria bacterium]|nr:nickel pincer cofactor biosynthesis protein LarC [Ignavibacteria bacterium]
MKIAYFDTFSGISGDMVIGAFLNAGLSLSELESEIQKLKLKDLKLSQRIVQKSAISASLFEVQCEEHHHSRRLKDIVSLISESELSEKVKEVSLKIFNTLGYAEAKIHNVSLDEVHFHEIGAIDSIVDIVGAAICLERFGIEKVFSSVIPLGSGFVETQHGKMPVPAPATLEILKNYPVKITEIPFELTTPTGAAIISSESSGLLFEKNINVERIGFGAGTKDIPKIPNLLRLVIADLSEMFSSDETYLIETNIDDMNPEFYPYVIEKLFEEGVHDAYLIPIIMKKGRPGIILSTLCESSKIDSALKIIYSETTTLGVRIIRTDRRKINRSFDEIETKFGKVKVKISESQEGKKIIPEFEECKKLAKEKNIPISKIYDEILKKNK